MENGFSRNVKKYGIADKAASVRQNPAKNRLPGFYQGRLCLRALLVPKDSFRWGSMPGARDRNFFLVRCSGLVPPLPGPGLVSACGKGPGGVYPVSRVFAFRQSGSFRRRLIMGNYLSSLSIMVERMFLLSNINICKAECDLQNGGMMQKTLLVSVAARGFRHLPAVRRPGAGGARCVLCPGAALHTSKQPVYSWAE